MLKKMFDPRGDRGKHKEESQRHKDEVRNRKALALYSPRLRLEAPRPSRDHPETGQNAHDSSGNAGLTGYTFDKQRQKIRDLRKGKPLSRKPVSPQAGRGKKLLEPPGHDDTEPNKKGPPPGNTPDELAHSHHTAENLGENSTLEGENTGPGSWLHDPPSGITWGGLSHGPDASSRAASVSETTELPPSKSEEPRTRRGKRNQDIILSDESYLSNASVPNKPGLDAHGRPRDADVDEASRQLQGEELQRTETRHEEEDSGYRAVRDRISRRLYKFKLEHSPIVSTHFDREIPRSCSLEDIEMAIDGLVKALSTRSRDEDAQKKKELEDKLSTLEREKEKEKNVCIETATSVLRAEYKKTKDEQQSAWRTKEKYYELQLHRHEEAAKQLKQQHQERMNRLLEEHQSKWKAKEKNYELQLHRHEEAAKQLKQQHQERMSRLLEEHQSKWKAMVDGYDVRIQQLENEKETWENKYSGKAAELEQRHQTQITALRRDKEVKIREIRTKYDNVVIQLEDSIEQLKSEYEGRLSRLGKQHQEDTASLQKNLKGEIAQKEKDFRDQVSRLERNSETTINELYAKIKAMREGHDEEMMKRDRKMVKIKDDHEARKMQMKNTHEAQQIQTREAHEAQQRQMREDHNAIVVALGKQREEEQRSLWKRIESLKEALVKGDRFKAMSDRELARRFQDLTSDVDAFARLRWDDGRAKTWPFPDKAFLNSENQRRDKQYLFQNTIWAILYEKIFCTPFRVLGKEGKSLEQKWVTSFGQDRKSTGALARGPVPTSDSEKWRYETIKECLDATSQLLEEGDANYNVKRDYELSVKEAIDDVLEELGRVASVSDIDKQDFGNLVRRAAKFWLEVGQQRYRLFLVMSDSGGEPSRSGQIAVDKDGTQKLVIVPELRRIGSGQGTGLENDELVADCKGAFSASLTGEHDVKSTLKIPPHANINPTALGRCSSVKRPDEAKKGCGLASTSPIDPHAFAEPCTLYMLHNLNPTHNRNTGGHLTALPHTHSLPRHVTTPPQAIYFMKMRNPFRRRSRSQEPPPAEDVPTGDLPEYFEPGRKVKAVEIRRLAELIRKRYELDVKIWGLRYSQTRDRPKVAENMDRSDATLLKIHRTIEAWDRRDIFESDGDWDKFKEIQQRLMMGKKRVWAQDPPWKDLENV